ncbi:DUF4232 domain-containing protein, partial [Streptomyces sp. SID3343]
APAPASAGQTVAPPGSPAPSANQSGGKTTTGGANSSGTNSGGKTSTGTSSGGQGATTGNSSTGSTGSGGSDTVDKCLTDHLKITAMDSTIGGDTDGTVAVTFKNDGGKDCVLSGYAGVDLKTNAGQISAERYGQPADRMVLKPGKSVSFGISYPINDTGGSGVRITDLLVTPPGETQTYTLRWPGAGSLPVSDGSGTPVKVGPIGSAGQGGEEG